MSRRKQLARLLNAAHRYVDQHLPDLRHAPLALRMLDGPPGSPRYAVTVAACRAQACPRGISTLDAAAGQCHVPDCPLRHTARLLLDRQGNVIQATRSGILWS
jgi:hypothetical protein